MFSAAKQPIIFFKQKGSYIKLLGHKIIPTMGSPPPFFSLFGPDYGGVVSRPEADYGGVVVCRPEADYGVGGFRLAEGERRRKAAPEGPPLGEKFFGSKTFYKGKIFLGPICNSAFFSKFRFENDHF